MPMVVSHIREVLHYLERFRNKLFIFHIVDSLFSTEYFSDLIADIARLHRIGIDIIIVADISAATEQALHDQGYHLRWHNHIAIMPHDAIPAARTAIFEGSTTLLAAIRAMRVNAIIGDWIKIRGRGVQDTINYCASGVVAEVNHAELTQVCAQRTIPIVPAIGWSSAGRCYHLSSVEAAYAIATELQSEKLIFLEARDLIDAAGDPLARDLTPHEAAALLKNLPPDRREYYLLHTACNASKAGMHRTHLLNGCLDDVIMREIFTNSGNGTMIYSNAYHNIRPMKLSDIPAVLRLMRPFVARKYLLPRTRDQLIAQMLHYHIYETDGTIKGSVALEFHEDCAILSALIVKEEYKNEGIGSLLVAHCCRETRRRALPRLFALTTRAADWFERLGFRTGTLEEIPEAHRKTIDRTRRSSVLVGDIESPEFLAQFDPQ